MKAVLVLDEMPKDCYDCPLSKEDTIYGEHVFICTGYNAEITDIGAKEDWCPLRSLPEVKDAGIETDMSGGDDYASGYRDGWYRGIEIG